MVYADDIHPFCVLSVCMVIGIAHGFIGSEKGPISRTTLSTMLRTWVRSSPYHARAWLNLAARAGLPRAYATKPPKGDDETPPTSFGPPEPSSYMSSVSEAATEANTKPLPFLSQPLGITKRPTSEKPSWTERHAEWFDRDVRLEKRRLMYV